MKIRDLFRKIKTGSVLQMLGVNVVYMEDDAKKYIEEGYQNSIDLSNVVNKVLDACTKYNIVLKRQTKDGSELIKDHEILDLLEKPNGQYNGQLLTKLAIGHKMLTGNSYIYAPFLNSGKTDELWVLPSQFMEVKIENKMFPVATGYKLCAYDYNKDFEAEQILHLKNINFDWDNGQQIYGMSPLKPGRKTVKTTEYAQNAQAASYANRGGAGLLYSEDGELKDETFKRIQYDFNKTMTGAENEKRVRVTTGKWGFLDIYKSPVDLELLKSQEFNINQIASIYNVPPILMNPNVANTYSNLQEAWKSLYTLAAYPRMYDFIEGLNNWLVPRYGKDLYLDLDDSNIPELQADRKSMVEWLSRAYWLTEGQKMELMGLEYDEADPFMRVRHYPMNLMSSEDEISLQE